MTLRARIMLHGAGAVADSSGNITRSLYYLQISRNTLNHSESIHQFRHFARLSQLIDFSLHPSI